MVSRKDLIRIVTLPVFYRRSFLLFFTQKYNKNLLALLLLPLEKSLTLDCPAAVSNGKAAQKSEAAVACRGLPAVKGHPESRTVWERSPLFPLFCLEKMFRPWPRDRDLSETVHSAALKRQISGFKQGKGLELPADPHWQRITPSLLSVKMINGNWPACWNNNHEALEEGYRIQSLNVAATMCASL